MQENLAELAKVSIRLEGMEFSDPVMMDPLSGKVYEIKVKNEDNACVFEELVLADYPFLVVERETIKFN